MDALKSYSGEESTSEEEVTTQEATNTALEGDVIEKEVCECTYVRARWTRLEVKGHTTSTTNYIPLHPVYVSLYSQRSTVDQHLLLTQHKRIKMIMNK